MNDHTITASTVTKRYGDVVALDRVDLDVPRGAVYGLVGPNGAGKTTMLGLLAGLRTPTAGTVEIEATRVGVLPDTPNFDKWLTGREVVELSWQLGGRVTPPDEVDTVLSSAGLVEAADRKVKGYSRGMLQRLGLAAAVVNRPDVLLLDEPAAALDPAGRREVLDLVAGMRGSATVLLSSHILDDVQEVCDQIGILRRGEIVYQGPLQGLLDRYTRNRTRVTVRHGADILVATLEGADWVKGVEVDGNGVVIDVGDVVRAETELMPALASAGVPVVSVVPDRSSLEDIFLEVTR